ncbi:MAG: aspartate carbamoyltransferase regulatory subunit [Bacillota bacterium]|nr:MAG: aspartate carbamoyltransferase regulatory subunit [Bacillota bacterium]
MIEVASIKRGIVIDHITAGKGLLIFNKLNLASLGYPVVLLMNVPSGRMGKKDIIKIENFVDVDTAMLGLIDSSITVNVIESEHVTNKVRVSIPQDVKGLFTCSNPRCVTNTDSYVMPSFRLHDKKSCSYSCEYCEEITRVNLA